ncbi:alpha/beta hydrolase [Sporosarcina gallistercoris]|uniref:Alpha/beta hydrolase n=1 Tax=Sporosarcina gallistercoris TaxID=2762245 RepID=A0ABR8PK90_9BACL|nr:alpha/beta hydrolase [Sporosarcina gallistercoris]MBD7908606.1 alpha/beta hydrolase [Sporosarcina gallistercoris]
MKKTVCYKKTSAYELLADFYPTDRANAPVILYIHGGGFIWGDRNDLSEDLRKLYTEAGFALFSIDYRLAPESHLKDILDDVQDALQWLALEGREQFSVNVDEIAVIGSSAGGFLALCTGTLPVKPKAIVSFYGYGDLFSPWAKTPSVHYLQKDRVPEAIARAQVTSRIPTSGSVHERFLFYLYCRQTGNWIQEVTDRQTATSESALRSLSPITQIDDSYPPTLFLHGTKDADVPYEQSVFMRAALLQKGVPAKLITIPNGDHVFEKDFQAPIVQNALQQVIEFLSEQLSR